MSTRLSEDCKIDSSQQGREAKKWTQKDLKVYFRVAFRMMNKKKQIADAEMSQGPPERDPPHPNLESCKTKGKENT